MNGNERVGSDSTGRSTIGLARFEGPAELRTGGTVYIRAIRPDDGPRLVAFHAALSAETVVRRYFRRVGALSAMQAAQLAQVDGHDAVALVVTSDPERDAPLVAVARYNLVAEGEAEIGLVVADAWQGRGIGAAVFARLVEHARAADIASLRVVTQTSNARVLGMARRAGYPCVARLDALEVELRLDIRRPALEG